MPLHAYKANPPTETKKDASLRLRYGRPTSSSESNRVLSNLEAIEKLKGEVQYLYELLQKAAVDRLELLGEIAKREEYLKERDEILHANQDFINQLVLKASCEEKSFRNILNKERIKFEKKLIKQKEAIHQRNILLNRWVEVATSMNKMSEEESVQDILFRTCDRIPSARKVSMQVYNHIIHSTLGRDGSLLANHSLVEEGNHLFNQQQQSNSIISSTTSSSHLNPNTAYQNSQHLLNPPPVLAIITHTHEVIEMACYELSKLLTAEKYQEFQILWLDVVHAIKYCKHLKLTYLYPLLSEYTTSHQEDSKYQLLSNEKDNAQELSDIDTITMELTSTGTISKEIFSSWQSTLLEKVKQEDEFFFSLLPRFADTIQQRAAIINDRIVTPAFLQYNDEFKWYIGWCVNQLSKYGTTTKPPAAAVQYFVYGIQVTTTSTQWSLLLDVILESASDEIWSDIIEGNGIDCIVGMEEQDDNNMNKKHKNDISNNNHNPNSNVQNYWNLDEYREQFPDNENDNDVEDDDDDQEGNNQRGYLDNNNHWHWATSNLSNKDNIWEGGWNMNHTEEEEEESGEEIFKHLLFPATVPATRNNSTLKQRNASSSSHSRRRESNAMVIDAEGIVVRNNPLVAMGSEVQNMSKINKSNKKVRPKGKSKEASNADNSNNFNNNNNNNNNQKPSDPSTRNKGMNGVLGSRLDAEGSIIDNENNDHETDNGNQKDESKVHHHRKSSRGGTSPPKMSPRNILLDKTSTILKKNTKKIKKKKSPEADSMNKRNDSKDIKQSNQEGRNKKVKQKDITATTTTTGKESTRIISEYDSTAAAANNDDDESGDEFFEDNNFNDNNSRAGENHGGGQPTAFPGLSGLPGMFHSVSSCTSFSSEERMRKAEFFRNPNNSPLRSDVTMNSGNQNNNIYHPNMAAASATIGATTTVEAPKRPKSVPTVRSRRIAEKSDFRTRFLQHGEGEQEVVDVSVGGDLVSDSGQELLLPGNQDLVTPLTVGTNHLPTGTGTSTAVHANANVNTTTTTANQNTSTPAPTKYWWEFLVNSNDATD